MSDKTWKRVGHGRGRDMGEKVGGGRRGTRRGEMEKVSIYLDGM